MRLVTFGIVLSIGSGALAQGYQGEGPGIVRAAHPAPALGQALAPDVAAVGQILLTPLPGASALDFYLTATVRFTTGGNGWDVISGRWNEQTQVFVRNADVDHLNSPGDEFACTVSPDLLTLVMDTPASHPIGQGGPVYATRSSTSQPFGPPQPISGVPLQSLDPQLCRVDDRLCLMYVVGDALWVAAFDDGVLSEARILTRQDGVHSPSPIADGTGNAKAVIYAVAEGPGHSSAHFTADIETGTGAGDFEILDRDTWLANPDANAGLLRYAEATAGSYGDPQEVGVLAIGGTRISIHGGVDNLRITAFLPPQFDPGSLPFQGLVFIGQLGTAGIPIPGFGGSPFSLQPSGLIALPPGQFDKHTGRLEYAFRTPPLPHVVLQMMPLALDFGADPPALFLGNNAPLVAEDDQCLCITLPCGVPDIFGNCPAGSTKVDEWIEKKVGDSWGYVSSDVKCIKPGADRCNGGKHCVLTSSYEEYRDKNGDTYRKRIYRYVCQ